MSMNRFHHLVLLFFYFFFSINVSMFAIESCQKMVEKKYFQKTVFSVKYKMKRIQRNSYCYVNHTTSAKEHMRKLYYTMGVILTKHNQTSIASRTEQNKMVFFNVLPVKYRIRKQQKFVKMDKNTEKNLNIKFKCNLTCGKMKIKEYTNTHGERTEKLYERIIGFIHWTKHCYNLAILMLFSSFFLCFSSLFLWDNWPKQSVTVYSASAADYWLLHTQRKKTVRVHFNFSSIKKLFNFFFVFSTKIIRTNGQSTIHFIILYFFRGENCPISDFVQFSIETCQSTSFIYSCCFFWHDESSDWEKSDLYTSLSKMFD